MPARSKKRASDVNEQESAGSDGSYSPVDVPAKKRARNSASTKSASKGVDVEQGRDLVTRILVNSTSSALTDNEDPMDALLLVAKYARYLENMVVASASQVAAAKPSPEQIHAAAEKLRKAACSQIRKQMTVSFVSTLRVSCGFWHDSCLENTVETVLQDWFSQMVIRWNCI